MSKFTSAMNAARQRSATIPDTDNDALEPQTTPQPPRPELVATIAAASDPEPLASPTAPVETTRRGRPAGKRSSHATVQVTAYIDAQTHLDTKIQLLQNARTGTHRQDFSELVQYLLSKWLDSQR